MRTPIGSVPSPSPGATTYAYGNLATETDALGRQTVYTYDSLGHVKTVTPPIPAGETAASVTTTYDYDELDHLKTVTAPLARVTSYTYDANGNRDVLRAQITNRAWNSSYAWTASAQ